MILTEVIYTALLTDESNAIVRDLCEMALGALARMYRPEIGLFAFRLRRREGRDVLEGASRRYTAVALIGLASANESAAKEILGGMQPLDVCDGLLKEVADSDEIGEIALALWAARQLGHPASDHTLDRLRRMDPVHGSYPTVEVSWCLSSIVCANSVADEGLAEGIANRLVRSYCERSALFSHLPEGAKSSFLRKHVACFADLVYPIQALSGYHEATGDEPAATAAKGCANRMCELQGPQGQWWWHFDVRTGRVIEKYPVYGVHQDSMAPMAILALRRACGDDHTAAAVRGLAWLRDAREIAGSLIDTKTGVIWRKVARNEPGKLVRSLNAAASRLHPSFRVPGADMLFRPGAIDFETRPYHMGWILHTWARKRARAGRVCPAGQSENITV